MFLSKDNRGYWYIYYETESGAPRRKSTGAKLKSGALKYLQTFVPDDAPKKKKIRFTDFTSEFLPFVDATFASTTAVRYRIVIDKFVAIIGNLLMAEITPKHFDLYKAARLKTKSMRDKECLSPVTVNIELRTLSAAFATAVRWKVLRSNPFAKQAPASVPDADPIFFSKEDFQKLIDKIEEAWLKELVVFATLTGLRRGELVNLRWCDVDIQRKTVTVKTSPTFKSKGGRKRIVPLSEAAYYIIYSKVKKAVSEYVFTLNSKQIGDSWASHKFKRYVYECRFPEDRLHFHSLRHTFASWLVQDGASLYEVQLLLGHSDIGTTQVYAHLQPEQLHSTVNRLHVSLN